MVSVYAKLCSHVLAIRERAAVNMHGTLITLARLEIVSTIKNLICRCLLMIVRCDTVENYMFLRDSLVVSGWMSLLYSLQVQDRTT